MQVVILNQEKSVSKKNWKIIVKEKKVKKKKRIESKKKLIEVRKTDDEELLRKIMVKIRLERINIQEGVIVEVLLDSRVMGLIMSSEFTKKIRFKLKKIKRLVYIRNVNEIFNKERPIEYTMEVNIYYQKYKKRTKIDIIDK